LSPNPSNAPTSLRIKMETCIPARADSLAKTQKPKDHLSASTPPFM
jgi:hypothetical protein